MFNCGRCPGMVMIFFVYFLRIQDFIATWGQFFKVCTEGFTGKMLQNLNYIFFNDGFYKLRPKNWKPFYFLIRKTKMQTEPDIEHSPRWGLQAAFQEIYSAVIKKKNLVERGCNFQIYPVWRNIYEKKFFCFLKSALSKTSQHQR